MYLSMHVTNFRPGIKFTIEMKNLGFAVGEVEPFFASIAIYNIRTKKRLSENAYFESNSENVLSLIYKKEKLVNDFI